MKFAIYNKTTNSIRTWVTAPQGTLPDNYEFRDESNVPSDAQMEAVLPEPVTVPKEISLRQFLMAADRTGLLSILEALKTSPDLPTQTKRDIHFFLEYSNFIERDHPLIQSLAPIVGVTSEQIDNLFRLGDSL